MIWTQLRTEAKNDFKQDFFNLINTAFEKTIQNGKKHIEIKLMTTEKRRSYLLSEPNYHTKWFTENLLANETKQN